MLDIHTHILPKMDDGSKEARQSRIMLRREMKQGIDRIVFTPHFYADKEVPEKFEKRRNEALALLENELADIKRLPECYLGAEVAFFNGMSRVEDIERFCIGNTQGMLIEMPFCRWSSHVQDELGYLRDSRGIQPIVAHVERYMRYQTAGTIRQMCEAGIWMQANATFFTRWQTSWLAMHMLKSHTIQFVGSDCHDTKHRPPNLGDAISLIDQRLGQDALHYLARMEERLLEGV